MNTIVGDMATTHPWLRRSSSCRFQPAPRSPREPRRSSRDRAPRSARRTACPGSMHSARARHTLLLATSKLMRIFVDLPRLHPLKIIFGQLARLLRIEPRARTGPRVRFSRIERCGNRLNCWNTADIVAQNKAPRRRRLRDTADRDRTRHASRRLTAVDQRRSPEPDGPQMTIFWPRPISRPITSAPEIPKILSTFEG